MRLIGLAVVLIASLILAPLAGQAEQATGQRHRIGLLNAAAPGGQSEIVLRALGYVEGRTS
jgi:hypothetical protein